jgi:hypothetical protein
MLDANGVVMAACQALHRRVVDLEREVAELKAAMTAGAAPGEASTSQAGPPDASVSEAGPTETA